MVVEVGNRDSRRITEHVIWADPVVLERECLLACHHVTNFMRTFVQALCTWITCEGIERCRFQCGGHGRWMILYSHVNQHR